jgi:hypothetical protein
VVELDIEASRLVKGNSIGKDGGKPRIPCNFRRSYYIGLCVLSLNISIIPYSSYEEIDGNIIPNPSKLEPTDMTILLSNRIIKLPLGVLKECLPFLWTTYVSY